MNLRYAIILSALTAFSIFVLTVAACGGDGEALVDQPTATDASVAPTADSSAATTPGDSVSTASPTATPVADAPDTSSVSLPGYITMVCGETVTEVGSWEGGDSLRDLSAGLAFVIEQMSVLKPPTEVADWHDAQLEYLGVFKETIDDFLEEPGDRTEDEFILSMFFTVGPHFEPVEKSIATMAPEVRARMTEAGCIGEGTTRGGIVITEFASISAGGNHTCGVGTDGYVGCWGEDWNGSTQPPDGEFSSVSAGEYHTCGVMTNGTVACWGSNDDGEATPPEGEFASVSAGTGHPGPSADCRPGWSGAIQPRQWHTEGQTHRMGWAREASCCPVHGNVGGYPLQPSHPGLLPAAAGLG